MAKLNWEKVDQAGDYTDYAYRAKVPGGWLVATRFGESGGITFVPDPNHSWS